MQTLTRDKLTKAPAALKQWGSELFSIFYEVFVKLKDGLMPDIKRIGTACAVLIAVLISFAPRQAVIPLGANGAADLDSLNSEAYIAGTSNSADLYVIGRPADGSGSELAAAKVSTLTRGTPVRRFAGSRMIGGEKYYRVQESTQDIRLPDPLTDDGIRLQGYEYIKEDNLSFSEDDIVREKEIFVRTPSTIYAEAEGPAIASFAPKKSRLEVTGFDRVESDGSVHKYKVRYEKKNGKTAEGYVYGKYMTDTKEKARMIYNENGIHDKAKKDKYSMNLYGGKASHLDYFPYEKPEIEGNEFCEKARTMYLNSYAVVHPSKYIKIIRKTDCNAVVCDIKDGVMAYKSDVAKELSPRSYKTAYVSKKKYKKGIDKLKKAGVYTIGRIVVFNDPIYAKDHPKDCIIYGSNTGWPSPYSRSVWEYNVRLAQEAIEEFGFNEIQFDYVRFPENSYEMSKSGVAKFRNKYDEEKGQAIQNFCFYAADQIHEAGAYFSIDVFGESAYGYMTAYGQYWTGLSNIVDAISAMPYTDHMGGEGAWENPYATMKTWAKRARKQQKKLSDPAAARTWITGYDTPYWSPEVIYGKKKLKAQVRALEEKGLDGGFIPWNSASSLAKYRQYKAVWNE